jgi:streptogramin lyase
MARRAQRALLVLAVGVASLVAAPMAGAAAYPELIPLPTGFQPEGIAVGAGPTAYVGSLADGDVYRIDLRTGAGETFVEGPGSAAVGLAVGRAGGLLWVAGGPSGQARAYDTATGELVADYDLGGGFVNDVVATREAAFFTDSFAPVLYRVELTASGRPGPAEAVPLVGFPNVAGFNANGIVAAPDGSRLIVVNSATGQLFRVDPDDGTATEIDLGGANVGNGDGLVLTGTRLFVVQNVSNQITELQLAPDWSSASIVDVITDPAFDIPSTAARFGPALYAVNARFNTPPGPDVDYDVVRVTGW